MNLYQQCFELRVKRLKLQKEADLLEQQEKDLMYGFTRDFTDDDVTENHEGFILRAKKKMTPLVTDWAATLSYVKETGQLDLLQKRLTESAVKARWDSGVSIPGVTPTTKYQVTIEKE